MCALFAGSDRSLPVIGLSLILALKCDVVLLHLLMYGEVMITTLILALAGPAVFTLAVTGILVYAVLAIFDALGER